MCYSYSYDCIFWAINLLKTRWGRYMTRKEKLREALRGATMDEVNNFDMTPYDRWAPKPSNG